MYKLVLFSLFSILNLTLFKTFAQVNNLHWAKLYEEPRSDVLHCLLPLSNNDILFAGWTNADSSLGENLLLVRLNQNGDIIWQYSYGGPELDYAQVISNCSDNNILVGGHTHSFGAGSTDILLLKFDLEGNILWQKAYGTYDDNAIASLLPTDDGGFLVGGWSYLGAGKSHDAVAFKTDSEGNVIWQKHYGSVNYEGIKDIIKTKDGNYIFLGLTSSELSQFDILVVKIDANGNIIWKKTISGPRNENPVNIIDNDDKYLIIGTSDSFASDDSKDIFIIALDDDGNFLWGLNYPDNFETTLVSASKFGTNKILAIGNSHPKNIWQSDMLVAIFNLDGEFINGKLYGGTDNELGFALTPFETNSFLAGGYSYSFSNGNSDVLLISTDEALLLPPGEVLMNDFTLSGNPINIYPTIQIAEISTDTNSILTVSNVDFTKTNPNLISRNLNVVSSVDIFDERKKITYQTTQNYIIINLPLGSPTNVTIKILNILGQEISSSSFTNSQQICLSTKNFKPGFYYALLKEHNLGIPIIVY